MREYVFDREKEYVSVRMIVCDRERERERERERVCKCESECL